MSNKLREYLDTFLVQFSERPRDGSEVRRRCSRQFSARIKDGAVDHVSVLFPPERRHHGWGSLSLSLFGGFCTRTLVDY